MGDILTHIIFLPILGTLLLSFVPKRMQALVFGVGLSFMLATLAYTVYLFWIFQPEQIGFQFVENYPWIPTYGITYHVGVDGISLVFLVLTALLSFVALLSAWRTKTNRPKVFVGSLLILESAMLGTFAALDMFLFYVFWEAMLIPMYFLIGIFGGSRRIYATLKFFLYTMAGSVLMLVGILGIYHFHQEQYGFASTAFADLYRLNLPFETQLIFFLLFSFGFAIKIPIFPFHTWLPDAHVEAPTAGSIVLAGILLKMGGYGFIRLGIPLFPEAAFFFSPYLATLAVFGIVYGAYMAWAQEDIKKLVAYSSVSHMGFVVLGIAALHPAALGGAVFQMIAHGLSTGTLFFLVGMIYERRHTRMIVDFGGLAKVMPKYTVVFFVITLASIGLPGLSGFVGEFLVLIGTGKAFDSSWFVAFAVIGVVLGAAYMLILFDKVFLGTVRYEENRNLRDIRWVEGLAVLAPLLFTIWLGVKPGLVLKRIDPAVISLHRMAVQSMEVSENK